MPLKTIDAPARDEGFEIGFTMADGEKRVRCTVQQGALEAIAPGTLHDGHARLERFTRYRGAFEAVLSSLYDAGLPLRVTSAHLKTLLSLVHRHPTA